MAAPPDPQRLLRWYDGAARTLVWRIAPQMRRKGVRPDPYKVLLSEFMLQQTGVTTVVPYFEAFCRRWPRLADLAAASRDDVLRVWAGLGYYARARNLHRCAQIVHGELGGHLPQDVAALKRLPGIGDYTAAAISAIAFDGAVVPVDGNVERIVTRLFAIDTPAEQARKQIREKAQTLLPNKHFGAFGEALMDLGATICLPRKPHCSACPWKSACMACAQGTQARFPIKRKRAALPHRQGRAYVAIRDDGAILLRRRPQKGLLAAMAEVPTRGWDGPSSQSCTGDEAPPFGGRWRRVNGEVRHTFTHFRLSLSVDICRLSDRRARAVLREFPHYWWSPPQQTETESLPRVMRKVIAHAMGAQEAQSGDQETKA